MAWVALIPVLPVLAFAALIPRSRAIRNNMLWLSVAAMSSSFLLSLAAFAQVWPGKVLSTESMPRRSGRWHGRLHRSMARRFT